MDVFLSVAHIFGALLSSISLGWVILYIAYWESSKNQKIVMGELSVELGVRTCDLEGDLKSKDLTAKVVSYYMKKYSGELLRNRVSDFCGYVRIFWNLLGCIIQILILIVTTWYVVFGDLDNAVYAWSVIGVLIFFFLISFALSIICKLATGRYPGEAKAAREFAVHLNNQI